MAHCSMHDRNIIEILSAMFSREDGGRVSFKQNQKFMKFYPRKKLSEPIETADNAHHDLFFAHELMHGENILHPYFYSKVLC